jgi:hypothetical protein
MGSEWKQISTRYHRDKQAGDFINRPHPTAQPRGLGPKRGILSRTMISGDFPAHVHYFQAIIQSLLERTAEPAQAGPDTSSVERSLKQRSPHIHQWSQPESFGLQQNTFHSPLFMFPLIPLSVFLCLLLIPSHLSSLVLL